jgi:hypothetical protein
MTIDTDRIKAWIVETWSGLNKSALVKTGLMFAAMGLLVILIMFAPCILMILALATTVGMIGRELWWDWC